MMSSRSIYLTTLLILMHQTYALIPATPSEQTQRAIVSTRETISKLRSSNIKSPRIFVDYLLPIPMETSDGDLDPWPGGLAQMYPYAEKIVKDILLGIVTGDESSSSISQTKTTSSQVISSSDCCGLFIQESPQSPSLDIAALLFPGPDQFSNIKQIEDMVGDRTLILFNKQFTRNVDFGFFNKNDAQEIIFDRYRWGFAFQELACRGEDVKLTFELSKGWQACAIVDDGNGNNREIDIFDPSWDMNARPEYLELEKKINNVLPEPLWMRKMAEVREKGLKFQRTE